MLTEEQVGARRLGIGGSDCAAVCKVDDESQPLDVWLEKVKGIRDETIGDKEAVQWGHKLEHVVAMEWAARAGKRVRRQNKTIIHPELSWMRANIDMRIPIIKQGLEVKARGYFAAEDYGPSGTDQVKESDIMQCMHYMAVTGWDLWHMAVLIGGQEMRSYSIPRDDGLIDNMISIESNFWRLVETKTKPPIFYEHKSTSDLLRRMYPGTNGATVMLNQRAMENREEQVRLSQTARDTKQELDALKNEIRDMIGSAAVGLLPGGGGYRRKLVKKKTTRSNRRNISASDTVKS